MTGRHGNDPDGILVTTHSARVRRYLTGHGYSGEAADEAIARALTSGQHALRDHFVAFSGGQYTTGPVTVVTLAAETEAREPLQRIVSLRAGRPVPAVTSEEALTMLADLEARREPHGDCGHEPEGRELALDPALLAAQLDGRGTPEPEPSLGHRLSRAQIAKHGRDRYPTAYLQFIKLTSEAGELGDALLDHDPGYDGMEPEVMAQIRREYADTGLALYALGDKLGLDLIEVMEALVAGDTRSFAAPSAAVVTDGNPEEDQ